MNHLEENNILSPQQHGFRRKRSCETQLLELTEDLNETMEMGKQTDMIVLDFAKAFDKVNHDFLLHKLQHMGITGKINAWIKSFLADRRQAVVVEGNRSDYCAVKSGVPQGSVLGPSLFLLYINDLPEPLSASTRLFADDTAVYKVRNSSDDSSDLQNDLRLLEDWERTWEMSFHPAKCTTLPVTRKTKPFSSEYQLHGHTLETAKSVKYLGVTLQDNLKWDLHINNTCNKANKSLGFLRRNVKINSIQLKQTAYKTYVRPILEYASTVWDPSTTTHIKQLESVQRRAARFVANKYHSRASVSDMLANLSWTSLEDRRKTARLAMLYKIQHGLVRYNTNKLLPAPTRSRRTNSQQLKQITCRTEYRSSAFLPRTIREWNSLPEEAVAAPTLDTFVSRVRC